MDQMDQMETLNAYVHARRGEPNSSGPSGPATHSVYAITYREAENMIIAQSWPMWVAKGSRTEAVIAWRIDDINDGATRPPVAITPAGEVDMSEPGVQVYTEKSIADMLAAVKKAAEDAAAGRTGKAVF